MWADLLSYYSTVYDSSSSKDKYKKLEQGNDLKKEVEPGI